MRHAPLHGEIKQVGRAPGISLYGVSAMAAAALVLGLIFNAANLPAPLYVIYRERFGFSEIILTVVYAIYMAGSLTAMMIFGRVSDQIGRRPVLYLSIVLALASTIVFLLTFNTATLMAARFLSGLALGLTATACTAWIAELAPEDRKGSAALFSTGANVVALGVGPLITGLLAQYAPWPLRLTYAVYLIGLTVPALVVWTVHETVRNKHPLSEVTFRPRLGVPEEIVAPFIAPAVTAFVAFALMGFYSALIPTLLKQSLKVDSHAVGGGVIFLLFACGTLAIAASARWASRTAMFTGLGLLFPGVALLVLAQHQASMALLLVASAVGGVSCSLGYRGSLQVINEIAPQDRRAETVSTYLRACYTGVSLPVIGIGILSAFAGSEGADIAFAGLLWLLAMVAIVVGWRWGERRV